MQKQKTEGRKDWIEGKKGGMSEKRNAKKEKAQAAHLQTKKMETKAAAMANSLEKMKLTSSS